MPSKRVLRVGNVAHLELQSKGAPRPYLMPQPRVGAVKRSRWHFRWPHHRTRKILHALDAFSLAMRPSCQPLLGTCETNIAGHVSIERFRRR